MKTYPEYPKYTGLFKVGTEVVIPELNNEKGIVKEVVNNQYLVILEDDSILIPESSIEFASILDTPMDYDSLSESLDYLAKANPNNKFKWTLPGGVPIIGKPKLPHLIFCIGSSEGPIPHVHIFHTENDAKAWRNGACLILNQNRYYDHANNRASLKDKELNSIVIKLMQTNEDGGTLWEEVIKQWNKINPFKLPPDTEMPPWNNGEIRRIHE